MLDEYACETRPNSCLSDGSGNKIKFPGVYRRIKENLTAFVGRMKQKDPSQLGAEGNISQVELEDRLRIWVELVSKNSKEGYDVTKDALLKLFGC